MKDNLIFSEISEVDQALISGGNPIVFALYAIGYAAGMYVSYTACKASCPNDAMYYGGWLPEVTIRP